MSAATPEQLLALLDAPHWMTPGSTRRPLEPGMPRGRRTEGQAAMNITVADHKARSTARLDAAAKLSAENSTLAHREAAALREAVSLRTLLILDTPEAVRAHACPACGAFTLLPRKGRVMCVNRHCARPARMWRSWTFEELSFLGAGAPGPVRHTRSETPPPDAKTLDELEWFFRATGTGLYAAKTLAPLFKTQGIPRWRKGRGYVYSLSDAATVHAAHVASRRRAVAAERRADRPPCTGLGALFFAEHPSNEQVAAAKRLCEDCPMRAVCLDLALAQSATDDRGGIYGGLTTEERKKVRANRKRAARDAAQAGTEAA